MIIKEISFHENERIKKFQSVLVTFLQEIEQKKSFLSKFSQQEQVWVLELDHQKKPVHLAFSLEDEAVTVTWRGYCTKEQQEEFVVMFSEKQHYMSGKPSPYFFSISAGCLFSAIALTFKSA